MDKRWGMRNAGTWHLTCIERSNTVRTFRKLVDCNVIKERLIKERKKNAPKVEPATSANIGLRDKACAGQALGTSPA